MVHLQPNLDEHVAPGRRHPFRNRRTPLGEQFASELVSGLFHSRSNESSWSTALRFGSESVGSEPLESDGLAAVCE